MSSGLLERIDPPGPTPAPQPVAIPGESARSRLLHHWPVLIGVVAGVFYAAVGVWLFRHGNYAMGDSVVRSANARVIMFGRDPHLGAIGLVWMPMPVLVQTAIGLFVHPIGSAWAAAPLSSAMAGGATVWAVARLGRQVRLDDRVVAVVVGIFAFNPVVILYAASGMSEPLAILFLVLAVSGFLRWSVSGGTSALAIVGVAMGLATATRYEMVFVALVLAACVAVGSGRGDDRSHRFGPALMVALPALSVLAVWFAVSQVITGDAFHSLVRQREQGTPTGIVPLLPMDPSVFTSLGYVVERAIRLAPVLLVLVPVIAASESLRATRLGRFRPGPASVLAASMVFPGLIAVLLLAGTTYGSPRHFLPLVAVSTVLTLWVMASPTSPAGAGSGLRKLLVVALLVGCVTATVTERDPRLAAVTSEYVALNFMFGADPPDGPGQPGDLDLVAWRAMVERIDSSMARGDLVVADTTVAFPALALTDHPKRFLIPEDRDFEALLARRPIRFEWVLDATTTEANRGLLASRIDAVIDFPPPGMSWREVYRSVVGTLYHLEPAPDQEAAI